MALVRCSCVTTLVPRHEAGGYDVDVTTVDPGCGYVVHRIGALLDRKDADDVPA